MASLHDELTVFAGVFSAVDMVAAGFWIISMHEVGPPAAQLFPQFVPGAHSDTLPLVIATFA